MNRQPGPFSDMLAHISKEGEYLPEQIFNVDEKGLFWKKMPDKTDIAKEEKKMSGFKVTKDSLTVLLGANTSGYCKL